MRNGKRSSSIGLTKNESLSSKEKVSIELPNEETRHLLEYQVGWKIDILKIMHYLVDRGRGKDYERINKKNNNNYSFLIAPINYYICISYWGCSSFSDAEQLHIKEPISSLHPSLSPFFFPLKTPKAWIPSNFEHVFYFFPYLMNGIFGWWPFCQSFWSGSVCV